MEESSQIGRKEIYTHLQKVKVIAVAKGLAGEQHQHMQDIPNTEFIKTLQQLRTNGYVKEAVNQEWSFYMVTHSGLNFFSINTR